MPTTRRRQKPQQTTQKPLRGGSVPFLNPAALGISGPADLAHKLDLWGVSCHGQTTVDKRFLVVPKGTYLMFTAHSGEPAEGEDAHEAPYISYKGGKATYYEGLYNKLFKSRGAAPNDKTQYPSTLYLYEPGDVMPDYQLFFRNTLVFLFKHGVYRLPVEELSGEGKHGGAYIGRPLEILHKAWKAGLLQESDLLDLSEKDKKTLKEATEAELTRAAGIPETAAWTKTAIYQKLETECCRGPTNFLFQQSPAFKKEFAEANYTIRLSQLLQMLPELPAEKKRFMFMSFCRVSLHDMASRYGGEEGKYPTLLRTMSFAGKCSAEQPRAAFNILTLVTLFCRFPKEVKQVMLKREEVRNLVRILKTVLPRGWKGCLEGTYQGLTGTQRVELIQNFQGYLTMDDVAQLAHMYSALEKLSKAAKAPAVREAFGRLAQPFHTLHEELGTQRTRLFRMAEEKREQIEGIYRRIQELVSPIDLRGYGDYLKLSLASKDKVTDLVKALQKDDAISGLKGLKEDTSDEAEANAVELIQDSFLLYMGHNEFVLHSTPFPEPKVVEDDCIDFDDLDDSSNSNSGSNSSSVGSKASRSSRGTRRSRGSPTRIGTKRSGSSPRG